MAEVNAAQSTQLDFHQAMQDFRIMFPDMDANVIETVLRSNHGAVHATIDQLLTMTTDIEVDLMRERHTMTPQLNPPAMPDVVAGVMDSQGRPPGPSASLDDSHSFSWDGRGTNDLTRNEAMSEQPPSYTLFASPPPSYQQAVPQQSPWLSGSSTPGSPSSSSSPPPPPAVHQHSSSPPPCLQKIHNWRPMLLPLPPTFLRPPALYGGTSQGVGLLSPHHLTQRLSENAQAREVVGGSDTELAQYLADERVALFLQNDEFMHELRANRDFMAALQREYEERVDSSECDALEEEALRREAAAAGATGASGRFNKLPHVDDATLKARIATMGKASRKKFAQIARVFSRGGSKRGGVPTSVVGNARMALAGPGPLDAAVAKEGGAGTDHLLEAAHPIIDEEDDDEEEERILDDVVIGSLAVAEIKDELSPRNLTPHLSTSPRHAR